MILSVVQYCKHISKSGGLSDRSQEREAAEALLCFPDQVGEWFTSNPVCEILEEAPIIPSNE